MIRAILVTFVAATIAGGAQAQDMTLRMLHFFASGYKPTPKDQRRYVSLLPKSATRYVYWELTVRNRLHNVRNHSHSVVARWYNEAGAELGSSKQTFTVRADWTSAWIGHGKGFREPGRWAPGVYRVDIHVDGRIFARRRFAIYDDAQGHPNSGRFAFTGLRLFESPFRPLPVAQRSYATVFDRATTRYLFAEVKGTNLLHGQRDQYPIVMVRFLKDDGTYVGETIINRAVVRSTWKTALLAGGWGWRAPGHWPAGRYRVEVWLGNDDKVGETAFVIRGAAAPPPVRPAPDDGTSPEGPVGPKPDDRPQTTDRRPDTAPRPPSDEPPPWTTPPPKAPAPRAPSPGQPSDLDELEKM